VNNIDKLLDVLGIYMGIIPKANWRLLLFVFFKSTLTLFSKPMLQRLQSESVQINTKQIHIITSIIKIMGVH
jgi:hypothetical protein